MKHPIRTTLWKSLAAIALAGTITACNDGSDNPLPADATVNVSPISKSFDVVENTDEAGLCVIDESRYIDQFVTISVTNGQGSPIGQADLAISADFGGNTFSGYPVMALYDDNNGNGVIDGPGERVTDANDPLFRTKTAEYTGERVLILRMNLSCAYRGSVNVMSDGFTGTGDFEVRAEAPQ